jgi:predicted NBD/HSP70 family sugar kinase
VVLERALRTAGRRAEALYDEGADWDALEPQLGAWIATAAGGLAHAAVAACSVFDFEAVVVDGSMPAPVRDRLIDAVAAGIAGLDTSGIAMPPLRAGSLGPIARALGGASLPLFDRYLVETTAEAPTRTDGRPLPRLPSGANGPLPRTS